MGCFPSTRSERAGPAGLYLWDPCVLAFAGVFGYADRDTGCDNDCIGYYKKRFLASQYDNGTLGEFTDDPVIVAFDVSAGVFARMSPLNDVMALPRLDILESTLAAAQSTDTPSFSGSVSGVAKVAAMAFSRRS